MSRKKSRRSSMPQLVREESAAELVAQPQANVHRLTGPLHDMLDAIISGCAVTAQASAMPALMDAASASLLESQVEAEDDLEDDESSELFDEEPGEDEPSDEAIEAGLGELGVAFGGVALTTRILARALLARVLGRSPSEMGPTFSSHASSGSKTETEMLDSLAHALLPASLPAEIRPSRAERREAFDEAAVLLREVGLEEFDVSCQLDTTWDGTATLFAYSLPSESAHVALLEFLFDRAEGVATNLDPLLEVERAASWWEFSRWSVSPPTDRGSEEADFARHVRELEYSLVDRRTVTLGIPVMSEMAKDKGFAELFPRQHRMAVALGSSFVDVFECVALEGHRATMRSMRDGRTYHVHEQMDPIEYAPGWVAAGRLLPFRGEMYLRSPGMIFFQPEDPTFVRTAAQELAGAHATLPPALALEAFIASAVFDVTVPRAVKPAHSRADARDKLEMVETLLSEEDTERERVSPDATLEAFMAALAEQAAAGDARGGHRRARGKKKMKRRR